MRALIFLITFLPAPALHAMSRCVLMSPMKVTSDSLGFGKKSIWPGGTTVSFRPGRGTWIAVESTKGAGYAAVADLKQACAGAAKLIAQATALVVAPVPVAKKTPASQPASAPVRTPASAPATAPVPTLDSIPKPVPIPLVPVPKPVLSVEASSVPATATATATAAAAATATATPTKPSLLGLVKVTTNIDGATVRIDGAIAGYSPLVPFPVAGGPHTITLEKDGFITASQLIEVAERQTAALSLDLLPAAGVRAARATEARRAIAFGVLGGGIAMIGGGTALAIIGGTMSTKLRADVAAYNNSEVRTQGEFEQLWRNAQQIPIVQAFSVVGFGVGAAALATSIALLVLNPTRDLQVAPGPGTLSIAGRF